MCSKFGYADYIHDAGITCTVEDFIRRLERERILEAIGTCPCNCPQDNCECGCGEEPEFTRNELLYIIKGENE
jgi:hypothetical protein